jgi:hypothetical protein
MVKLMLTPWLKSLNIDQHDLRVRFSKNKINPLYIRIEGLEPELSSPPRKGIIAIAHAICPYCRSDGKSLLESLSLFDSSSVVTPILESKTQKDFLLNVLRAIERCGKHGIAIDFDILYRDIGDWKATLEAWRSKLNFHE